MVFGDGEDLSGRFSRQREVSVQVQGIQEDFEDRIVVFLEMI